ncbi:hypothetical protein [Sphingobacterium sp. UBA5670]|uniref:hypothetical protein n=1 Tax=Sphingobacterium sp. UBA5670 TaxID=1947502 RepID=UPI0025EA9AA8|nr:hypothetical protein [Sphingobacterium sp. UBA5670]
MHQIKQLLVLPLLLVICMGSYGQEKTVKGSLFEGIAVAGYTDHGAYINCTGPAVKYIFSPKSCLLLGLLPSLKLKEDKVEAGKPKNSWVTPTLGFGLTAVIRHIAIQLPAFYAAKTGTADGKWRLGVGIGYKF